MSQARSQRVPRHGSSDRRAPASRGEQRSGRPPSSARSSSEPPAYYSNSSTNSRRHGGDGPREEMQGSKWTYICSRRGIVLMCAVLTNVLVLICVVAAMMVMSGMSAMGGLAGGSFNINSAYTPFEGTELQQVRDLDMQYNQMRSPGVYGGLAFSLSFGVVSLLFVVSGNRPAHLLPARLLLGQFFFQLVGAVAYVVAVGLYLHFVIRVNGTDICKLRERLYARQGYTWMNCSVGGADAAVALFGLITAGLYAVGCALTGITIHRVKRYLQEVKLQEAITAGPGGREERPTSNPQRAPLTIEKTFV